MKRCANHTPLIGILLLALGVRLVNLTYHSLWFDEVVSAFWAAQPAAETWRVGLALSQDKHPPLYYLLLHGWSLIFGPGDAALRSLGALIGALAVLPTYGIGVRLGGRRAGLIAALLAALNPFLVWYSQEARMFMPATTFVLVGLYGLLRIADPPGPSGERRRGDGELGISLVILGFTAALYSYLYGAFMLPVAGAWLLLLWWLKRGQPGAAKRFWIGVAALAAVAVLFLPLANAAWRVSGAEATPGRAFAGMGPALLGLLKVYALGWPRWDPPVISALAAGAGALALFGALFRLPAERDRAGSALLIAWVGVDLLIGGILLSREQKIFMETRYHIVLVPALCLAWGRALAWLWEQRRPAGLIGVALAVGVTVAALPYNWVPENRREAWREAAAFVEAHVGPRDAILIQADYVNIAFQRYYRGPLDIFFPFTDRVYDPARVDPPLAGMAGYDAVWLVQSHHQDLDPGNLVAGWFGARFPLITEVYPAGIAIHAFSQHYRTPRSAGVPPAAGPRGQVWPVGTALGDLRLLACDYQPTRLSPRDDLFHPPSGWVHVTTYWTTDKPPATNLVPRISLVDAAGQVWGLGLERGNDTFHLWPTARSAAR